MFHIDITPFPTKPDGNQGNHRHPVVVILSYMRNRKLYCFGQHGSQIICVPFYSSLTRDIKRFLLQDMDSSEKGNVKNKMKIPERNFKKIQTTGLVGKACVLW